MRTQHCLRAAFAGIALIAGLIQPAKADIVIVNGDTTSAATFHRPDEYFDALSEEGTAVRYSTFSFVVDTSGIYTFLGTTPSFDGFSLLYRDSFDPANALANAWAGNDDLFRESTTGFETDLDAGTAYTLVLTGFGNADAGKFSVTIGGPGVITAVPEPSSWLMLGLGLAAVGYAQRRTSRA